MAQTKDNQQSIPLEGYTLPQNADIERDILGSIMFLGDTAFGDVERYLSPTTFYDSRNKIIFNAIVQLKSEHKPFAVIDVCNILNSSGKLKEAGGVSYISSLASNAGASYLQEHAQLLRQMEMQREAFFLASKAREMALDSSIDIAETLEYIEKGLTDIQTSAGGSALSMDDSITAFYDWLKSVEDCKTPIISTGLSGLDSILNGGFRSPDLIIIGGRPSMGKTQFAVFFSENAALQHKYVYFVSIEMTATQLVARMAAKGGLSYTNMRKGTLTPDDYRVLEENIGKLAHLPINIADCAECRQLSYIKSEARRLKRKGELDMIVIDYLQLIRTNQRFEKRYIEVGYITGELKALAKELQVPVILLAQLSRPPKGEEKKAPKMEDLRESGDIEQDADIIILPHRPWVYDQNATDSTGRTWKGRGKLIVAKNREGERNVDAYFTHDQQFKEFYDDEFAQNNSN